MRDLSFILSFSKKTVDELKLLKDFYKVGWNDVVAMIICDRAEILRVASTRRPEYDFLPLRELEQRHVHRVLEACDFHHTRAAKILGITVEDLRRRVPSSAVSKLRIAKG
jgi:DNA-binding NtrC family response regulator